MTDTGWVLACTALVMVMAPGLAIFYAGYVDDAHIPAVLGKVAATVAVVSLLWVLYGYTFAFGGSNPWIGALNQFGLGHPGIRHGIPEAAFAAFQLMFAALTPALIVVAAVDWPITRWLLFVIGWTTLVYLPIAHWVFDPNGWLARMGVVDFAGGTAVHLNAGMAGLVIVLTRRRAQTPVHTGAPRPLWIAVGAALLWFGWFGFNAGSALAANASAAQALIGTHVAACAGAIGWCATRRTWHLPDAAAGAVTGLVAITPAAGVESPWQALVLGLLAGIICAVAAARLRLHDVDLVASHAVGGVVGTLAVGVLGAVASWHQLGLQTLGCVVVGGGCAVVTWPLARSLHLRGHEVAPCVSSEFLRIR